MDVRHRHPHPHSVDSIAIRPAGRPNTKKSTLPIRLPNKMVFIHRCHYIGFKEISSGVPLQIVHARLNEGTLDDKIHVYNTNSSSLVSWSITSNNCNILCDVLCMRIYFMPCTLYNVHLSMCMQNARTNYIIIIWHP